MWWTVKLAKRIQDAIGVTMVKKTKLTWYGPIARFYGMADNSAGGSEINKKERKSVLGDSKTASENGQLSDLTIFLGQRKPGKCDKKLLQRHILTQ